MDKVLQDIQERWGAEWREDPDFELDLEDHRIKYKFSILEGLLRQLPPDAKVIEIGCGTSAWLRLLKQAHPGIRIYGLDISPDALRISAGYGVHVIEGDVRHMPIEDDAFDLVYSFGTVEHFPETEQAVREHLRILKPGGFAWIETPNRWSPHGLEVMFSNWRHGRDTYRLMIEQGKWYTHWELKRMALSALYPMRIRLQGSGPVIPYYRFLGAIDPIFPRFIRRFFGGGAGVVVQKRPRVY